MKKVFSNSECIHTFAQQTQSEGQNSGCTIFFRDKRIYSYGHHYLLGEFIDGNTIIINNEGYSVSTSKHISILVGATRQYKQFFTTQCDINIVYSEVLRLKEKLGKAKKQELYTLPINRLFESLNKYLDYIKDVNIRKSDKYKEIKAIHKTIQSAEGVEKIALLQAKLDKAKKAREAKEIKERLAKFMNYEIHSFRIGNEDFLRISQSGEYIETTQGVKISTDEAKTLYNCILNKQNISGYRIGNYTVKSLNGCLTIGCHNINIKNMHSVGKQLIRK